MKDTRYLLTTSFYIYAQNDEKAKAKAETIVKKSCDKYDNWAEIDRLLCSPFAQLERRKVI